MIFLAEFWAEFCPASCDFALSKLVLSSNLLSLSKLILLPPLLLTIILFGELFIFISLTLLTLLALTTFPSSSDSSKESAGGLITLSSKIWFAGSFSNSDLGTAVSGILIILALSLIISSLFLPNISS